MRIRKNALMLSLIASFLMAMAVVPSYAQMATLSVDPAEIVQETGTFIIDIYVDDVENMWGFHLSLFYDTSVLTATYFESWAPFTEKQGPWIDPDTKLPTGGVINDAEGYVEIAFSYPMGSNDSLTKTEPVPIASIDFTVDAPGASPLKIVGSTIVDIDAYAISHTAMPGWFRTEAGLPLAQFVWIPGGEDPFVYETLTFTSTATDLDGYIEAWDWDFGDGTTATGPEVTHHYTEVGDYTVTLTVTDDDGNTDTHTRKVLISPEPIVYGPVDLRNSHAAYRRFSVSERDPETINLFTAWVKNLSPDQETFVRVMWTIVTSEGVGLGEIIANGTIGPKALKKFTADFNVTDPTWEYEGERKDYDISVTVEYADYWIVVEGVSYPHLTRGTYSGVKTNWFRVTTLP